MSREFVIVVLALETMMAIYTVGWVIRPLRREDLRELVSPSR